MDGSTLLEATTGEFDSTAAPTGMFARLKVSALTATGKEAFSYYFYPLGETYFKQKLTGLSPGQNYSIEAYAFPDWRYILYLSKIKVRTMIQKRADLYTERIDSPQRLPAGIPVQIVGVVTELNGQIGARSNCVLYANGVEVDRSVKIWVDSGDTVSCAFSPTLTIQGPVTVPNCFDYFVGQANGRTFYTYVTGCGNLYVEVGSFAGTVTYASRLLTQNFVGTGANAVFTGPATYVFNNVTTEVGDGEKLFHGDAWTVDVAVTAGPFTFNMPVTVILDQHFDDGQTVPAACTTTSSSLTCTSSSWRIAGRSGTARVERPE